MRRRSAMRMWPPLVAAGVALAFTGCGSDDEESGDTTDGGDTTAEAVEAPAPTKKEYIAAADKICKQSNSKGSKIVADVNDAHGDLGAATTVDGQTAAASRVAKGVGKLADLRDGTTSKLKALEAPKGGPATKYLASRRANTKGLRDQAKAYKTFASTPTQATSDAATAAATKSNALAEKDRALAEKYGFKVCGQPAK